MIDLFGMRQKDPQEPSEPAVPAPADAPSTAHAPRGSHRLWAFLLVLDSIFVMVFGGVVASKVYHYWRAPALVTLPPPHHRPMKTADGVKPAETAASTATTPTKPAEPPKAVEVAKPAPKTAPAKTAAHADAPRPPKPSLLNDPPKPRSTPTPAGATAAAATASTPAADGKTKAAPVVFKLKSPNAKVVQLVGAFIVRGGRKDMSQDDDGLWSVKLYLNPGQYRYFFAVDKKKTLDPENPQSDRGASLLTIP